MLPTLEKNQLLQSQRGLKNLMLDAQLRLKVTQATQNPTAQSCCTSLAAGFPEQVTMSAFPDSLPALATQKQRAHLAGRLASLPETLPCLPVPPWPYFLVPYLDPKKQPTSQLQLYVHWAPGSHPWWTLAQLSPSIPSLRGDVAVTPN